MSKADEAEPSALEESEAEMGAAGSGLDELKDEDLSPAELALGKMPDTRTSSLL